MSKLLTPREAAEHHEYHRLGNAQWFRKRLGEGLLTGSKLRGRWYVTEESIEAMLSKATNSTVSATRRQRRRRTMREA